MDVSNISGSGIISTQFTARSVPVENVSYSEQPADNNNEHLSEEGKGTQIDTYA